ncbi:hypothetical protein CANCADRAFT_57216 [Tortispora caseinolytica NRRL Y-17796]|uniref:Transcription elongation factor SPT5 n=1 Tax=Tortispora caseinolytica NRRL Y-17796 TaxID=767744 RepID=A0A1E4TG98_9ASCO|nr:hypothetical protein CANCADRAFT_57216 [Tortispora caseinolytica NRRL Y-17796]
MSESGTSPLVDSSQGNQSGANQTENDLEKDGADQRDEDEGIDGEEDEENEDEDEEDEDDEDEEDEDDDIQGPSRKRARPNQFLDVEAEVDEDEEEVEEEDDELGREDGFIEESIDAFNEDDRAHRQLDRQRQDLAEADAERIAEELRERYGRSTAAKFQAESGVVPQRLLLPSIDDPTIWGVRARPGREKHVVEHLMRKKIALQYTKNPMQIISAFQRDSFAGYVYIEARKQSAVMEALKGVTNVFLSRVVKVPLSEYTDLLRAHKSQDVELKPGMYVRIKRGKYSGDLAVVENFAESGLEVRLKIIPRLDYGKGQESSSTRKRPTSSLKNRPPAGLFSEQEALKYDPQNLQRRGPNLFIYAGDEYIDGYLFKDYKISHLETQKVDPRLDEVMRFGNAEDDGIDLRALAQSINKQVNVLQPNDLVEIFEGEQAGVSGHVTSVDGDIVTLVPDDGPLKGQGIEVLASGVRKRFSTGDHVKVVSGRYKDNSGMIVGVSGDEVTIVADNSQEEFTVFSRDLVSAAESGGVVHLGKYDLHDLIQFNGTNVGCIIRIDRLSVTVIDRNDVVTIVQEGAISLKITEKNGFATDKTGNEIRTGDTIKEIEGKRRQGTVLHIYRDVLFCHDRKMTENSGVFACNSSDCMTVMAKGGRVSSGPDLNRMNPNLQVGSNPMNPPQMARSGGRDQTIGKSVKIAKGPLKGLIGIVKDATDSTARVELHAKSKIMSIDKASLKYEKPRGSGMYVSYSQLMTPASRDSRGQGDATPAGSGGGKTPAWASGGKTPSWAAGGKTPAWGAGGKTPAWTAGGRTPGYAGGGKTPAWNADQGRTPAWNADQGRTPAWNADQGRTPAWNGDQGRKPDWSTGAPTPGMSAPTPARNPWDNDSKTPVWGSNNGASANTPYGETPYARTPGAFDAAPTPAFTPFTGAPTPGAFHSSWDEAATPAVGAPTPGVGWNDNGVDGEEGDGDDDDAASPQYAPDSPE